MNGSGGTDAAGGAGGVERRTRDGSDRDGYGHG